MVHDRENQEKGKQPVEQSSSRGETPERHTQERSEDAEARRSEGSDNLSSDSIHSFNSLFDESDSSSTENGTKARIQTADVTGSGQAPTSTPSMTSGRNATPVFSSQREKSQWTEEHRRQQNLVPEQYVLNRRYRQDRPQDTEFAQNLNAKKKKPKKGAKSTLGLTQESRSSCGDTLLSKKAEEDDEEDDEHGGSKVASETGFQIGMKMLSGGKGARK
ncbi:MAG: hypothetical protein Q9169_007771 [Polycauliona sp. 2 TL-2023]